MGTGKNGTFDRTPDWHQWALLETGSADTLPETPPFLVYWWKWFHCEKWVLQMEALEGHGTWDGKNCFGDLPRQTTHEGLTGVLTRATIRFQKLPVFWKNAETVSQQLAGANGLLISLGMGEVPWIKQATFSIWESKEHIKQFAYQTPGHAEVIRKTRTENWYHEDMFVRFRIIGSTGTLRAKNPLERKS